MVHGKSVAGTEMWSQKSIQSEKKKRQKREGWLGLRSASTEGGTGKETRRRITNENREKRVEIGAIRNRENAPPKPQVAKKTAGKGARARKLFTNQRGETEGPTPCIAARKKKKVPRAGTLEFEGPHGENGGNKRKNDRDFYPKRGRGGTVDLP